MSKGAADEAIEALLVGGSAGSLEVVLQLLPALPEGCEVPVVLVIHQPPSGPGRLVDALATRSRALVKEPLDKEALEPRHVYVAPPDYHLLLDPGPCFALSLDGPVNYSRPSIDVLFESAADVLGPRCAAILLSGANADGARGLRAIRDSGGAVAVQAPGDAQQAAMPEAGLLACADASVLPAKDLAGWVVRLSGAARGRGGEA